MKNIRNIAIIAHVDHGKTTLVDKLLKMSGTFRENEEVVDCVMDSNAIERERGITILAKTTAINYKGYRINILDTPGHADFGGEVERIMNMVDGVLLIVDAYEGTMPQTRFVLKKALQAGVVPILVVNKIDKPSARPKEVVDEVLELFIELGADIDQLDFPVVYASALAGTCSLDPDLSTQKETMDPILDLVINHIPAPLVDTSGSLQFQPALLDYNDFVGRIGIGRVKRGTMKTVCDIGHIDPLPILKIDEPTLQMTFGVNTSPFCGKDGKLLTARKIEERLFKETERDVSLKVEVNDSESWIVSGRGELHLGILIENMRREGFELQVSKPKVIIKEVDGVKMEPFEDLELEVPEDCVGPIIEQLGMRGANLESMNNFQNQVRLNYTIPSRGLIGFSTNFMTLTKGYGIMSHSFKEYRKYESSDIGERKLGVLVSMENGKTTGYALGALEDRGTMFVEPGVDVYEGMIIGECNRETDLAVNAVKGKQLTNMRAAGSDKTVVLKRPRPMPLEAALEFINSDELVEVTPNHIRLRKKILNTELRKKEDAKRQ